MHPEAQRPADRGRRVWDLPVRCTHWLLVLALGGSWISAELPVNAFIWHEYCGYTVLVMVAFRLVWGIVGTRHARFSAFLRGPRDVVQYARRLTSQSTYRPSIGHNPLGGWVVLVMLLLLLVQTLTGLYANDEVIHAGPLYGWISTHTSATATRIHHVVFRVLQAIVGLHITAAALYCFVRRDNIVLPMLTGRKPAELVPESQQLESSRQWLAIAIVIGLAAVLALVIRLAPDNSLSMF